MDTSRVLEPSVLARSVVRLGEAAAWEAVFERLESGGPIVLGVFGASVAQVRHTAHSLTPSARKTEREGARGV